MPPPSLLEVLSTPSLRLCFTHFCEQQHCEENIFFWEDVEGYRRLTNPDELQERAKEIVEVIIFYFLFFIFYFSNFFFLIIFHFEFPINSSQMPFSQNPLPILLHFSPSLYPHLPPHRNT
jgi:hypothetical protein